VLGMKAIHTNKGLINEHFCCISLRNIANQSKPVATQVAACHANLDIRKVTQLHCHIKGIGENGNSLAMPDAASNLCRRSTCADRDDFSIGDKTSRQ